MGSCQRKFAQFVFQAKEGWPVVECEIECSRIRIHNQQYNDMCGSVSNVRVIDFGSRDRVQFYAKKVIFETLILNRLAMFVSLGSTNQSEVDTLVGVDLMAILGTACSCAKVMLYQGPILVCLVGWSSLSIA